MFSVLRSSPAISSRVCSTSELQGPRGDASGGERYTYNAIHIQRYMHAYNIRRTIIIMSMLSQEIMKSKYVEHVIESVSSISPMVVVVVMHVMVFRCSGRCVGPGWAHI